VDQIIKIMIDGLSKNMSEKDINVNFDKKVTEIIAKEGFDQEFGARPLQRFIQDKIEDLIAQKMLKDEIKRGDNVSVSTNDANEITITIS
jgi:ATP-dependent Clp protease ATP-binding subunit ClpC